MSKKYNILVTAVGGDIGQSMVRVLRGLDLVARIVGTDMSTDQPGRFFVDTFYQIPSAKSPDFLPQLKEIAKKEQVDFIIPVSEPELKAVSESDDRDWPGSLLVYPKGKVLPICLDKWETVVFLKKCGLPTPWTMLVTKDLPPNYPCILKDRVGWGSKSLVQIEDQAAAEFWAARRPQAIFQELLLPNDEEHTCGIFRSRIGQTSVIIFKRTLNGGLTQKAEIIQDKQIEQLCQNIAEAFSLQGSINVQLRKTLRGPIPFEINPRFSSTVIFRDQVGFHDVLWSLIDLLNQNPHPSFTPPVGTKIYRMFTEKIIKP